MGLRSLYPPFRAASARRQEAAVRFLYGFTGSVASTILFSRKFYKLKNRMSVARRRFVGGIAQSPHGHRRLKNGTVAPWSPHHLCAASARKPHGLRTITVWRRRRLHGNSTEIARFPYNLRAASVRIYPGLPPPPPYPREPVQEIARCS